MMRKEEILIFAFGLAICMTISFVVLAAGELATEDNYAAGQITDIGKNASKDLSGAASGFQQNANNALEQNVSMNSSIRAVAGILFGLKQGEQISLQEFVVYGCLLLILVLMIREILVLVPFFEQIWSQWVGAVLITLLAGISGGMQKASYIFFSLGAFIAPLGNNKLLQLFVSLAILAVLFLVFSKLIKLVNKRRELTVIERKAHDLNEGAKSAKIFTEGVEELGKRK